MELWVTKAPDFDMKLANLWLCFSGKIHRFKAKDADAEMGTPPTECEGGGANASREAREGWGGEMEERGEEESDEEDDVSSEV